MICVMKKKRLTFSWLSNHYLLYLYSEIEEFTNIVYDFTLCHIEQPLENIFGYLCYCINFRRYCICSPSILTCSKIACYSYFIAFLIYYLLLPFAYIYFVNIQHKYFIDPLLSANGQCVDIKFVRTSIELNEDQKQLTKNFLRYVKVAISNKTFAYAYSENNYTSLHRLFDFLVINNYRYIICGKNLYFYTLFDSYSSLFRDKNNRTYYIFDLKSAYFVYDRPPFIDICIYLENRSQIAELIKVLKQKFSHTINYYSSINLIDIDLSYTKVSLKLYLKDLNSTHLEHVATHNGWLIDMYKQFSFFTYDYMISAQLFETNKYIEYFDYKQIPVPTEPLLALTEMIQQNVIIKSMCTI
ncbi:unnamed protein product [Didymodactylos carnosus]|uniref:Uncharacterized protein n=1 Tax=Didymodactylos carnosus TaxID=1234261 RepID=A0A813PQY6_9BILA|nr:unnamed protein product [Didymodactylos carnosus]CAF0792836.1 unnamed protein product [Didymodactylos carnosus]CAF3536848.1 unnamed protein product [Didymodactylos carnosus]CAF3575575.1 unnamed protein product [Didymodactylos carnosus]